MEQKNDKSLKNAKIEFLFFFLDQLLLMLNMILTLIYIFLNISLNNWWILIPISLAYPWVHALHKWRQNGPWASRAVTPKWRHGHQWLKITIGTLCVFCIDTIYIHFESIYCIWMVSLFDWHSIAKAGQPCKTFFKMEDRPPSLKCSCNSIASID